MTVIKIFGGLNEIGGNKIFIQTSATKFFIDFGLSFSRFNEFYTDFLKPKLCTAMSDYLELNIIPKISGIYRNDLLVKEGMETVDKPEIDGVLLSHAHADHSDNIALLHKDVNIFCGETTKTILKVMQETSQGSFDKDYYWFKENFVNRNKKPQEERKYKTFRTGNAVKIGDTDIQPIHVDHSIPGSYGFLIYTPDSIICYTGDLRVHGNKHHMTRDFIQKASEEKVDVLFCEGTRVNEKSKSLSEEQVYKKVKEIVEKTKNLVLSNFPLKDTDRLNTFYRVSVECGRELVVPTKLAFLIKELESDKNLQLPKLNDVKVYMHKAGWGNYEEEDYYKWEREFLNQDYITVEDVKEQQDKYIMFMDFFDLKELVNIKPEDGSVYIYSTSEPHDEEQVIDFNRLMNWIKHFGLGFYNAHASGHADSNEIKDLVEKINAKQVIPIHTKNPLMFKRFSKNIIIPKYGEEIKLL
ncbi:MAG: MBL fold metallo-hydrolase [Candidatus Aenigmarchaeota archaeon]|nr:MBL fold metallo-hydrolase [Candidatus Aenigmarchaeota archaeon]